MLDLLPDPPAVLADMSRVLRPSGVVALAVPGRRPHRERWRWLVELAQEFYPTAVQEEPSATVDVPGGEAGGVTFSHARRDFQHVKDQP